MDYGDDDDDVWNDNIDLEALEAEARSVYASTQQLKAPQQSQAPTQIGRHITERDISALLAEKQRFEKLVQDKQGELNVLKSNISRTSEEHRSTIDKLAKGHAETRSELNRKLEEYKDQISRLETDLVFQRQELKNVKLRQGATRTTSLLSPQKPKKNGFPDREAFENAHSIPVNRKRRRVQQPSSTDDAADLDAFELAERRAQERNAKLRGSPMPSEGEISRPASPLDQVMQEAPDRNTPREESVKPPEITKLDMFNILLQADDGSGNILAALANRRYDERESIGARLLRIMSDPNLATAMQLANVITLELVKAVSLVLDYVHHIRQILYILHQLLFALEKPIARTITCENSDSDLLLLLVELIGKGNFGESDVILILHFILHVTEAVDREEADCYAIFANISTTSFKAFLSYDSYRVRIITLQILGRGAVFTAPLKGRLELLDYITRSLETDNGPIVLDLWTAVLQCVYTLIYTQESGLASIRSDRTVLPRLIKRIAKELDLLVMKTEPIETMTFLEMAIKLYYILMHEEACIELEAHWRSTFFRSAHIVAMTRVAFADEEDTFSMQAQEMARDLLELALSPEEGDDVYEVMMGTGPA